MKNEYIELTNASDKKLDKFFIKKTAINLVQKPQNTDKVGCIVVVMSQLLPVVESYEYVIDKLLSNE